jgi:hypothetical protein
LGVVQGPVGSVKGDLFERGAPSRDNTTNLTGGVRGKAAGGSLVFPNKKGEGGGFMVSRGVGFAAGAAQTQTLYFSKARADKPRTHYCGKGFACD